MSDFGEVDNYVAWLSCNDGELGLSEDEYKKVLSFIQDRIKSPIHEFKFYDFPEMVSTNDFYESKFWSWRQQIKKRYSEWLSEFYHVVKADKKYDVDYEFEFSNRPYDSSNTSGMLKMIEDVLFEKDNYKVVRRVSMMSSKGTRDCVTIKVWEVK